MTAGECRATSKVLRQIAAKNCPPAVRVSIPRAIAHELDIQPGDEIVWSVVNGRLIVNVLQGKR